MSFVAALGVGMDMVLLLLLLLKAQYHFPLFSPVKWMAGQREMELTRKSLLIADNTTTTTDIAPYTISSSS